MLNKRITRPAPLGIHEDAMGIALWGKFGVVFSDVKVTPEGWRRWGSLVPPFGLLPTLLSRLMLGGHL